MNNINTLADRYADLKAQIELLERALNEVKLEIKEVGQEEIVGEKAIVTLGLSERKSLDQKLIKEFLSGEEFELCSKTILVETIRVKAIKAA